MELTDLFNNSGFAGNFLLKRSGAAKTYERWQWSIEWLGGAERKITIKEVYRQEESEITIEEIRLLYKISYVIYTKKIW